MIRANDLDGTSTYHHQHWLLITTHQNVLVHRTKQPRFVGNTSANTLGYITPLPVVARVDRDVLTLRA